MVFPVSYRVATIRTYGTASKWSAEAVRSRGTSAASADDIFFGPQQSGTDWGAAFLSATSTDDAMKDYVKRNYSKFTGGTLEAMLDSTGLVDWYKQEMQKQIDETKKSIANNQDSLTLDDTSFNTSRTQSILASLQPPPPPPSAGGASTDATATTDATAAPDLANLAPADILAMVSGDDGAATGSASSDGGPAAAAGASPSDTSATAADAGAAASSAYTSPATADSSPSYSVSY